MPDISVSRTINAPAAAVWALVSDPTRMGEWSPENQGAEWLGDAKAAALGAEFRGKNKNGRFGWKTKCTVTECVPEEAFAFKVKAGPFPLATWAYRLTPVDGATDVTEEWTKDEPDLMEKIASKALGIDSRSEFNRVGMEATLAAMAAELEA